MADGDLEFVRALIERNRYLTLSTTDGDEPWIAPLEYIADENLNLYFFSPETSVHAKHIERNASVAVAIFDAVQPEYEPAPVIRIAGLQMVAEAQKLSAPFPALVEDQMKTWGLPVPPYAPYRIKPTRLFLPAIKDGVNERIEVAAD